MSEAKTAREYIEAAISALPDYPASAKVPLEKALTALDAEQEEKERLKEVVINGLRFCRHKDDCAKTDSELCDCGLFKHIDQVYPGRT